MTKTQRQLLTEMQQRTVSQARARRRSKGHVIRVRSYERLVIPWGQAEERVARLLNHITIACSVVDRVGRLSTQNRAFFRQAQNMIEDLLETY